jgi:phosphate starvation-inducible protein PhoH
MTKRITRKEKRLQKQNGVSNSETTNQRFNFTLKTFTPLTENQKLAFESYDKNKNLMLIGTAGTGKSFLSLYLAMNDIMNKKEQEKLIIVRSVVPSRDMGFLPGSNKEKSKVYEAPYYSIFSELFGRGDAYEYLKTKNVVEFMTTSFVRGITINDAVIVVDELQNMTWQEASSVFTRIGKNCKVIFAGDIKQNDLIFKRNQAESSGADKLIQVCSRMKEFRVISFTRDDIVRSSLVKSFITVCDDLGF